MIFDTFWTGIGAEELAEDRCEKCAFYHMIDSAYGYCKESPPKSVIVKLFPFRRDYEYPIVTWNLPCCGRYREKATQKK